MSQQLKISVNTVHQPEPRCAVLTGTTSGIGCVLCQQLLADGWRVFALDRDAERARTVHSTMLQAEQLRAIQVDLADPKAIADAVPQVLAHTSGIDALFCNAGVLLGEARYSPTGCEMHFAVNVVAPLLLLQALEGALQARRGTVVVSGSSIRKMVRSLPVDQLRQPPAFKKMTGSYAWSKQAIYSAFADLAVPMRAQGIQLRVVDLPPTKTRMVQGDGMPAWIKLMAWLFKPESYAAARLSVAISNTSPQVFAPLPAVEERHALMALLAKSDGLGPLVNRAFA